MSDLEGRLRRLHRALDGWEGGEFPILVEAADEIARLTADLDRVTKGTWSKEIARLTAEVERLTRENGRQRPTLEVARSARWVTTDEDGEP